MISAYKDLAIYYDLIYSFKDYKKEADLIKGLIRKYNVSDGSKLLEAGCGTGRHLSFLKNTYQCEGFDINPEMIDVARESVNGVRFSIADMIDFKFNTTFDIITCLFSSFAYVKTKQKAKKAIKNFAKHLNKGGLLIIESWFAPDEFTHGKVGLNTYEDDQLKLARTTYSFRKENLSVIEMHFLIAEQGKGIQHFKDVHAMGLFEHEEMRTMMEDHKFEVKIVDGIIGRKLFIGVKR